MANQTIGEALALGLLEGLTEFIPVSSTGHLLLAGHFLGFESTAKTFEVVIQLGAVLAIVVLYAERLVRVLRSLPSDPRAQRFAAGIVLAFLPAAAMGVSAHGLIKTVLFETPMLIALMLILGGVVLLFVDRLARTPRYEDAMALPVRVALGIGLFQCLALIPGVSRSGATIVGGLLMGAGRRAAAEFSFFLSMPTMLGAFTYDLWSNRAALSADDAVVIAVGLVAAFVAGLVVVRFLLNYVARAGFALFGWWRIIVGSAALAALLLQNG